MFPRITNAESIEEYNARVDEYMRGVIAKNEQKNEPRDKTPVILIPGHEVSGDDPVAPQIFEWVDLFHNSGYTYKVGYCQYFKPAANTRSHDKVVDVSYAEAVKRCKDKVHIVYEREVGTKGWKNGGSYVYWRNDLVTLKDIQKEVER